MVIAPDRPNAVRATCRSAKRNPAGKIHRGRLGGRPSAIAYMRILAGLALTFLLLAPQLAAADDFDDEVLAEMNYARCHPARYAQELREAARERDDYSSLMLEDPAAIDEAIAFLM